MTYSIFEGNMERLQKKLARIQNKCSKYGCEFKFEEVGEEYREFVIDQMTGETETRRYVQVEAEGTAIMNGWQFVATVQHTEKGNIIQGRNGIEMPERYYTCSPVCEHCKSNRRRKDTYIVRNTETGEFKQVGKSCLKDFTGGLSAEAVAQYISFFDTVIEGETPYEGCSITSYIERDEYLAFAAECIRAYGFSPAQAQYNSTKSRAEDFYYAAHGKSYNRETLRKMLQKMQDDDINAERPETVEKVQAALEWIAEQPEDNNYMHNLKTACNLKYITRKHTGLLASLFKAYDKGIEMAAEKRAKEEAESTSEYVGEIKERITINAATIELLTSWETMYGYTYLYKITAENGNIFIWKASRSIDTESKKITGTVKDHREYKGVKQTELTRCKAS